MLTRRRSPGSHAGILLARSHDTPYQLWKGVARSLGWLRHAAHEVKADSLRWKLGAAREAHDVSTDDTLLDALHTVQPRSAGEGPI